MEAQSFKAFLIIDSRAKFSPQLEAFFLKPEPDREPEEEREDDGGWS